MEENAIKIQSSTTNFDPVNGTTFNLSSWDNFVIGENFSWSVTGDLQIVGANIGSTVVIKSQSSSNFSGDIIASLNGCGEVYRGTIAVFSCDGPNKKIINGQCETGIRTCTSSTPTGHSNQFGELYNNQYHYVFSNGSFTFIENITTNLRCVTPD